MKRDYIEFDRIESAHQAIDRLLCDWARWVVPRSRGAVSPMFRLYRASEQWQQAAGGNPINSLQAAETEKKVSRLPEKHKAATRWYYVGPHANWMASPIQACRVLGVSREGLQELVRESRVMIANRGI